jgi:hypothetical protein
VSPSAAEPAGCWRRIIAVKLGRHGLDRASLAAPRRQRAGKQLRSGGLRSARRFDHDVIAPRLVVHGVLVRGRLLTPALSRLIDLGGPGSVDA